MEHQNPTLLDVDDNIITRRSLLQTVIVDNDAMVDFTNFVQPRFKRYFLEIDKLIPTVNSVDLSVRFSIAGDFKGGAALNVDYQWNVRVNRDNEGTVTDQDTGHPQIVCNHRSAGRRFGNDANEDFDLTFELTNLGNAASYPRIKWDGVGECDSAVGMQLHGMGTYTGATTGPLPSGGIDGIRFFFTNSTAPIESGVGLISEGTFRLYGQE